MVQRTRNRILKSLLYYIAIPYTLIIAISKLYFTYRIEHAIYSNLSTKLMITQICFYILLLVIIIVSTQYLIYKLVTERNIFLDRFNYRRNFISLLNYYHNSEPHKMSLYDLPKKSWQESDGIILGKYKDTLIELPATAQQNIAIFGIPKSGKTVTLIATALQFKGSIFAIDIKSDISAQTKGKRKAKYFSPSAIESSSHYDPLANIRETSLDNQEKQINLLAATLIPEEASSESKYFSDGARNFLVGICLYFIRTNPLITFPEIVSKTLLASSSLVIQKILNSDCTISKKYIAAFHGQNEKNVNGCYGKLCDTLRPFSSCVLQELLTPSEDCISVQTLEDGYDVYLQIQQAELNYYAPILALITQQFIEDFERRKEGAYPPILMMLDEFAQLRHLPSITTALTTLRSKNVTLLLAMQSLGQLDKWYSEAGRKEIIDSCATLVFIKIQDTNTRKWASDYIGTKKELQTSTSHSKSKNKAGVSINEVRLPVYHPEDFGDLGNDKLIISSNGKYIKADIVKYYENL